MNNVFVYCEIEKQTVEEVSLELLTKGRKLADRLGVKLEAICAGSGITGHVEAQVLPYGVPFWSISLSARSPRSASWALR